MVSQLELLVCGGITQSELSVCGGISQLKVPVYGILHLELPVYGILQSELPVCGILQLELPVYGILQSELPVYGILVLQTIMFHPDVTRCSLFVSDDDEYKQLSRLFNYSQEIHIRRRRVRASAVDVFRCSAVFMTIPIHKPCIQELTVSL